MSFKSRQILLLVLIVLLVYIFYNQTHKANSFDNPTSSEITNQKSEQISLPRETAVSKTIQDDATKPTEDPDPAEQAQDPQRLREEYFTAKYENYDLAELLKQPPLTEFSNVTPGTLFVRHESGTITTGQNEEIQFRRDISISSEDEIDPRSCISIQLPDKTVVFGSLKDGSLEIRQGPVTDSFLISINQTHHFLIYSDVLLWEELRRNPRPTGALLYFTNDEAHRAKGKWSKWTSADPEFRWSGSDFCLNSFD